MEDIEIIFKNDYGISFQWKEKKDRVQVVFRDTGFLLNLQEVKLFQRNVLALEIETCCENCKHARTCKNLLLPTPSEKIDLAVSADELEQINELLGATIFKLELLSYIELSSN